MTTEEILNLLHLEYKKKGSGFVLRCINPHHIDTHPSMMMNEEGVYNCYPCEKKEIFIHL